MVSSRWSSSMLFASLILLYWATSVKPDLSFEDREKAEKVLDGIQGSLSLFQTALEVADKTKTLTDMMKQLANLSALAPGIGALLSSVINAILVFIPQDDPVLTKVNEGFAQVDRKLDSLSIQISNLATDVEWYNYASVYSQDQLCILNAWNKFHRFFRNHASKNFKYLAEDFTSYYEYGHVEDCVNNLYYYLTVKDTSLIRNLNEMLVKKTQCTIREILKYNLYFSSLLWKGTVLSKVYSKLSGFNTATKDEEHAQMFKNVFENQLSALQTCERDYKIYVINTVTEMGKSLNINKKQEFAKKVKEVLDEKYSWNDWIVLVYEKEREDSKHVILYKSMIRIEMSNIIVAVDHAVDLGTDESLRPGKLTCFSVPGETCDGSCHISIGEDYGYNLKVTHLSYHTEVAEAPETPYKNKCYKDNYHYDVFAQVYLPVVEDVCKSQTCGHGRCWQLIKSNKWVCLCETGYRGDQCDQRLDTTLAQTPLPLPTIVSSRQRLKNIESKLDTLTELTKSLHQ